MSNSESMPCSASDHSCSRLARSILNAWYKADTARLRSALARSGALCRTAASCGLEAERLELLAGIAGHLDGVVRHVSPSWAGLPQEIEADLSLLAHLAREQRN